MHHLLKKIPKTTKATLVEVMFGDDMFATVPMTMIPPGSKSYVAVMIAIDDVMEPMVRSVMEESGLGGILSAMAGELDTKTTEDFIKNSEIMQKFTIRFI